MLRQTSFARAEIAILLLVFPALHILVGGSGPKPEVAPYQNPSLPIEQRVDDLVSRMTLEEKVLQMQHTAPAIPRLGIPAYDWWNEALHGVARKRETTISGRLFVASVSATGPAVAADEPTPRC